MTDEEQRARRIREARAERQAKIAAARERAGHPETVALPSAGSPKAIDDSSRVLDTPAAPDAATPEQVFKDAGDRREKRDQAQADAEEKRSERRKRLSALTPMVSRLKQMVADKLDDEEEDQDDDAAAEKAEQLAGLNKLFDGFQDALQRSLSSQSAERSLGKTLDSIEAALTALAPDLVIRAHWLADLRSIRGRL